MFGKVVKSIVGGVLVAALALPAIAQTYTAGTADVGSGPHYIMSEFSRTAGEANLGNVQVQEGMALTRAQLSIAKGELDIGTIPLVTVFLMRNGLAMFGELGKEQGGELAGNLRALFGMNVGVYHAMTFMDSGIDNWDDIKGKRVFVGPPTGGATAQTQQIIRLITGYEPGEDYEAVILDWGAGVQALLDGRVDMAIRPGEIPASYIDRLTSAKQLRLLGVPENVYFGESFQSFMKSPGTVAQKIPSGAYDATKVIYENADAEGNVLTVSIALAMTTNASMSDQAAYDLVSAFIRDLENIESATPQAASFALSEAVFGLSPVVGMKMHPGAIRAWEEAGVTIPDHLR